MFELTKGDGISRLHRFEVSGAHATPAMHRAILLTLGQAQWLSSPLHDTVRKAAPFFQGGSDSPDGEWFLVEFWGDYEAAQKVVDEINRLVENPDDR